MRPSCTRCSDSGSECSYEKLPSTNGPENDETVNAGSCLRQKRLSGIGLISLLNAPQRSMLAYFIENASFAISCHDSIQFDTCRALISAGSAFPCVLYSTLVFAAMHRASSSTELKTAKELDVQVLDLRSAALSMLQNELQRDMDQANRDVVMATALILATCDLRYNPESGTWRQHFEYTRSLMGGNYTQRGYSPSCTALSRFIHRRFTMLEFLVSLPTSWSLQKRAYRTCPDTMPSVQDIGIIDGTMACCLDLLDVFSWIGALEDIKYWSAESATPLQPDAETYIYDTAITLIQIVQQMMDRDSTTPPVLSTDLGEKFTSGQLEAYRICNTIAQHVALIYLRCYSLGQERSSIEVRRSVRTIIDLAGTMPKHVGSHPYICLTTALFVAGSEALGGDRESIRNLLDTQYQVTNSRNTRRALHMLDKVWSAPDHHFRGTLPSK